jgi:serine/threonine-protein kinase RsbW
VAIEFHTNSMRELGNVLAFVDQACAGVEADTVFAVRLAVEEAFTNIYKHGYAGGEGPVTVRVDVALRQIVATLVDEAPAFDPTEAAAPDLDAPWDQRRTGGLGCHLLRQMMDEVKYVRRERDNVLTLLKTRS